MATFVKVKNIINNIYLTPENNIHVNEIFSFLLAVHELRISELIQPALSLWIDISAKEETKGLQRAIADKALYDFSIIYGGNPKERYLGLFIPQFRQQIGNYFRTLRQSQQNNNYEDGEYTFLISTTPKSKPVKISLEVARLSKALSSMIDDLEGEDLKNQELKLGIFGQV